MIGPPQHTASPHCGFLHSSHFSSNRFLLTRCAHVVSVALDIFGIIISDFLRLYQTLSASSLSSSLPSKDTERERPRLFSAELYLCFGAVILIFFHFRKWAFHFTSYNLNHDFELFLISISNSSKHLTHNEKIAVKSSHTACC